MYVIYTHYQHAAGFMPATPGATIPYLELAKQFSSLEEAHEYLKNNRYHESEHTILRIVEEVK